jgi:hypothetical protein
VDQSPLLDQFYGLPDGPFAASVLLFLALLRGLQARLHAAIGFAVLHGRLGLFESNHYNGGLEQRLRDHSALLRAHLAQRDKSIALGIVDGDPILGQRAELLEEGREVDAARATSYCDINNGGLMRLLLLENKSMHAAAVVPPLAPLRLYFSTWLRILRTHSKKLIYITLYSENKHSSHLSPTFCPMAIFNKCKTYFS